MQFSKQNRSIFHTFAKNARLNSDVKIAEVLGELHNCSWDIVMFSETRSFRETVTLTSGDQLYSSTQPTNAAGVAILCHKRHVDAAISVQVVSERLMYLDLKVLTGLVRFVAVYMPHMGYPHHELQTVYDQLHLILDGAARVGAQVVVGGDFNTQLHVGHRGEVLEHFCTNFGLHVANDDDDLIENWTFRSSLGVRRRIDFILYSSSFSLASSCATDILDLNSDHRAVHAPLEMITHTRKKKRRRTSRWQPKCLNSYQAQLSEQLLHKTPESIHELGHVMLKVAESVGHGDDGAGSSSQEPWKDAEFQNLLSQRRACHDAVQRTQLSKRIRKILRARMREKRNHRIANILKDFRQLGDMEIAHFDPFRPCKGSSHNKPVPAEFASFLADIFKVEDELKHFSAPGCFAMIEPFTVAELQVCFAQMRVNKCPDSQGLVVEMFKHGGPVLWNTLIGLFNTILTTGTIETHWRNTLFMMIPKTGDLAAPNNWRPIAILQITYKIFTKLFT